MEDLAVKPQYKHFLLQLWNYLIADHIRMTEEVIRGMNIKTCFVLSLNQ